MQALAPGELPEAPIATLIDTELRSASDGEVVFTLTPNESDFSGLGVVHGAGRRPCTLPDSAVGCVVYTTLAQGFGCTSIDLTVQPDMTRTCHCPHGWVLAQVKPHG